MLKNSRDITFTVPGKPFGKERPKAAKRGRFITVYTPKNTVNYENKVKSSFLKTKTPYISGPVKVEIDAIHSIPKHTSRKNTELMIRGDIPCVVKPDADNIAKCILDPLNGVAFKDDNHVVALSVTKRYGLDPMVNVKISPYKKEVIYPLVIYPLFYTNQEEQDERTEQCIYSN